MPWSRWGHGEVVFVGRKRLDLFRLPIHLQESALNTPGRTRRPFHFTGVSNNVLLLASAPVGIGAVAHGDERRNKDRESKDESGTSEVHKKLLDEVLKLRGSPGGGSRFPEGVEESETVGVVFSQRKRSSPLLIDATASGNLPLA